MAPSRKGLIAIGLLALLLASLTVIFFVSAKRRDRRETCALNLKLLGMMIQGASPRDEAHWDDVPTGSAFWLSHEKWPVMPFRPIRPQMLLCPVKAPTRGRSGTDYRGPTKSIRLLEPRDPIGADKPLNHGPDQAGYVLLRSGELLDAGPADAWWKKAGELTSE